ncbi:hypothetical protein FQZ97_736260 [compost metagenome]
MRHSPTRRSARCRDWPHSHRLPQCCVEAERKAVSRNGHRGPSSRGSPRSPCRANRYDEVDSPKLHRQETSHAGPNAEPTPFDFDTDRARRAAPRQRRDRVSPCRGGHPPQQLGPDRRALPQGGQRAEQPRPGLWRPRGHPGLERLPPPGAVLRRQRHRPRAAHAQPAPAPRTAGLDRQPRRRPRDLLRHDIPAAGEGGGGQVPGGETLDRAVRRRQAAGRQRAARAGELRGLDGLAVGKIPLARPGRKQRVEHVLHERHHGQPQGRAVFAPLHAAARVRCGAARRAGLFGARQHPAGGADVPRQRLGPAVFGRGRGLQTGVPRAGDGRQVGLRTDRIRKGEHGRGRAHGVADAAGPHAAERAEVQHHEAHGDRRLGLPARHDQRLQRHLRRGSAARLGHDGNVAAGHGLHAEERSARAAARRPAQGTPEAGPQRVWCGHEDRQRGR